MKSLLHILSTLKLVETITSFNNVFFNNYINDNPLQEFTKTCQKYPYDISENPFLGRIICLILIPIHTLNLVIKPLIYTVITICEVAISILYLIDSLLFQEDKIESLKHSFIILSHSLGHIFCISASAFGQIIQLLKATGGIILPLFYFKAKK